MSRYADGDFEYERSHAHGRNQASFRKLSSQIGREANIKPDNRGRGATLSQTTWGEAIDGHKRDKTKMIGKLNCNNTPRRGWTDAVDPFAMVRNYCKAIEKNQKPKLDITDWFCRTMQKAGVGVCETLQFHYDKATPKSNAHLPQDDAVRRRFTRDYVMGKSACDKLGVLTLGWTDEFRSEFISLALHALRFPLICHNAADENWQQTSKNDEKDANGFSIALMKCLRHKDEFESGLVHRSNKIEIVDENDSSKLMPIGERGEIAISGPQVMQGYWARPDATAECLQNGRFLTGDIGVMDDDGYTYIVDRKKDMIVTNNGFNVYPRDIEEILFSHEAVAECAICGVPDSKRGEVILAAIVLHQAGSISADDVMDYLRGKIVDYMLPERIEFMDALPKSQVGKILKREIRDIYGS